MFYILNFRDHTFAGHQSIEDTNGHIESLLDHNMDPDCMEVVCADDESRMSVEAYQKSWGAA